VPWVCPSRWQPHVSWICARACSIDTVSEHFVLTQAAPAGAVGASSNRAAIAARRIDVMQYLR
jgi:hypothetical protein